MFSDRDEFAEYLPTGMPLQTSARPLVAELLSGNARAPMMPRARDARTIVTGILAKELERFLAGRGLKQIETTGGLVSYFPKGLLPGDRVEYVNNAGRKTYKKIVGNSEKLEVDWHLGMKLAVKLGDENVIRLRPYIVFSKEGMPLADLDRMAAIRKRFCKSWWNPHWRQLYEAFYKFWGGDQDEVSLYLGRDAKLIIDADAIRYEGMRRMPQDMLIAPEPEDPEEPEGEADEVYGEPGEDVGEAA